jgi:L-Ala-D/L-Glu epimerase
VKLTTLIAHRVAVPLRQTFTTAVRSADVLETVIVEARDGDGRRGWGEAPISVVTKTTSSAVVASVEGPLQGLLAGAGAGDLDHALALVEQSREPSAARTAVDCALHDLAAQQAGLPLAAFLAGSSTAVRPARVLTDMTLSVGDAEALAATAVRHVAEGFDCLKIKLDASHDALAAMRAVRAAVGPATVLRVDANQAFTAEQAIALIRGFEDVGIGIELVEQPVAAADWTGLAKVGAAVETPIMADESVWTCADLDILLAHKAAPLVNIKLAKTGGLRHARRLADRAADAGLGVVVGCMLESTVGIGAAAAFATTLAAGAGPVSGAQDLDGGLWLAASPVRGGARYSAAEILLPQAPGQGIAGLN